jgi:glutamyl/glutaminyl-tRNA synthetase
LYAFSGRKYRDKAFPAKKICVFYFLISSFPIFVVLAFPSTIQNHFARTRIAPTPSGFLHLGNVFSFAITAALARHTNASIFLRIDDLDQERVQPAYLQDIFDTLAFLDIPYDDGPRNVNDFQDHFSQLLREPLYHQRLQLLRDQQLLFACNCSRKQLAGHEGYPGTCRHKNLDPDAPDVAWRIVTGDQPVVSFRNIDGSLTTAALPTSMTDFIVRRRDGKAAYQLSSLADDAFCQTDLIVRGQDLHDSTLAQSFLSSVMPDHPLQHVSFFHHPLLLDSEGEKLSKSAGSISIHYLRTHGYSAAAVYDLIAKRLHPDFEAASWQELANCFFTSHSF